MFFLLLSKQNKRKPKKKKKYWYWQVQVHDRIYRNKASFIARTPPSECSRGHVWSTLASKVKQHLPTSHIHTFHCLHVNQLCSRSRPLASSLCLISAAELQFTGPINKFINGNQYSTNLFAQLYISCSLPSFPIQPFQIISLISCTIHFIQLSWMLFNLRSHKLICEFCCCCRSLFIRVASITVQFKFLMKETNLFYLNTCIRALMSFPVHFQYFFLLIGRSKQK